jgi:trehalose synthase
VVELHEVGVSALDPVRLRPVIGEDRYGALQGAAGQFGARMGGTRVWNINSTAAGGGVAEMLRVLVGYSIGLGLDVRWLVMDVDAQFFAITKRLHNRIHGAAGDGGDLGDAESVHYREVTKANALAVLESARRGDVAILHDPQAAGLTETLSESGVNVIWRCHIGSDHRNGWTEEAWKFLEPHIEAADALVFSRVEFVPPGVPDAKVAVIPPSIDPFSPKNENLSDATQQSILRTIGFWGAPDGTERASFSRRDGTTGEVVRQASILADGPLDPSAHLVVQVSRWDRLKDMQGVMRGFAAEAGRGLDAALALVGPAVDGVTDDPEGTEVLEECTSIWSALPPTVRRRIRLISLPMDDVDENGMMVNAIQRQATVIVQKSLAEGFGLTVAEAMWKAKPVVASAVGGIIDQVVPGTGVLLGDPTDLDAFGEALHKLLDSPDEIDRIGAAARRSVHDNYVGDVHLLRYAALIEKLIDR